MKRIYYDAEFTGLHINTTLISIGMVSDSGSFFYAEFNDYDKSQINDWLQKHIIDNLIFSNEDFKISPLDDYYTFYDKNDIYHWNIMMKASSTEIKERLLNWLKNEAGDDKIQFYTDCYAYDWVLLNHLICGNALDFPEYLYYIPVDLSTRLQFKGEDPDINRERFLGDVVCHYIMNKYPFDKLFNKNDIKHNSLWDAYVCRYCFLLLNEEFSRNFRYYPISTLRESMERYLDKISTNDIEFNIADEHPR